MSEVSWMTAFLDLPASRWTFGTDFWAATTGTSLSAPRGDSGRFATLLPADADACWRVQRLDDGPPGVHLDLHSAEPEGLVARLRALGARPTAAYDDVTVLVSPGGLGHCVVADPGGSVRPGPLDWGTHRSMLDQVCLDVPAEGLDTEVAYWSAALGASASPSLRRPEFLNLPRPAHLPLRLLVQRTGDTGPVAAHPDLAATDRTAEVERLVALGAEVETVEQFWTVLVAPDGRRFCVTERDPATGQVN